MLPCFSKEKLNIAALFPKSVLKVPFTRRGWMAGILILFRKRFKIDQYVLALVIASFNLSPRFEK